MARRRKKTTQKKYTRKMNTETAIVIMIVAGILSGVLIYLKSGYVGKTLSDFLGGIFGIVKYIVPIGFIGVAISLIQNKKDDVKVKLMQYGIILSCVCTVLSIYEVAVTKSLFMNQDIQNVMERAYYLGTLNKGGGIIGSFFTYPLIKLLGIPGTIILAIGLAVIFLVFMFGFKPSEFFLDLYERYKERKENPETNNEGDSKENQVETRRERRLREKEERRKQALDVEQLQIKFNENGNNPLGMGKKSGKEAVDPEFIEGNLFKQEDEKKEDNKKEVLQLEHAITVEDEHYEYPPINLLSKNTKKVNKAGARALTDTAAKLQKTLYSFGVSAKVDMN